MKSLKIKNFMAFSEDVEVKFSPKINVIIGENGTGKTQLLTLLHFSHGSMSSFQKFFSADMKSSFETLTNDFLKYFLPLDDKLGKLHHIGGFGQSEVNFLANYYNFAIGFHNNSKNLQFNGALESISYTTLIPAKEVLSFMEGFVSMYDKYLVRFPKYYNDICLELDHPVLRPEKLREKSKQSIDKIEKLCGGKFIFHGGGKVTFKTFEDSELSVNAMAEGYRKIGMLARLLKTGAINFDTSGPLLWDEPEANMNPNIMKLLVEILLELARNGQQIILTTHDYVLLKWFDLLMDKEQGDIVHYHRLYRDDNKVIRIESVENYIDISNSAISDTYNELIQEQVRKKMGGLGK